MKRGKGVKSEKQNVLESLAFWQFCEWISPARAGVSGKSFPIYAHKQMLSREDYGLIFLIMRGIRMWDAMSIPPRRKCDFMRMVCKILIESGIVTLLTLFECKL